MGARANIATPQAYISEIFVDSIGNWTIEMGFFYEDSLYIDSMRVVTSLGSALITNYSLINTGGDGFFEFISLITDDNLSDPIVINPEADFVKIISYAWGDQPFDYVAFGDYPGSFLDCLEAGESVITLIYYNNGSGIWEFCMDNSPTIGLGNDTTGAMGTFSGIIYDPSGIPFSEGKIFMPDIGGLALNISPDGSFNHRVPCRNYMFDTIQMFVPSRLLTYYAVEAFSFCLHPNSSQNHDIITTSLITGVEEQSSNANFVTVAPNPFSDHVVFYFNMNNNDDQNLHFSIYSLEGKMITQFPVSPGEKRLDWNPSGDVSQGTYIYRLENNNQILKTGKFVRL